MVPRLDSSSADDGRSTSNNGGAPIGAPDYIELRGLRVSGFCGLLPEELERRQPLEFDLDVYVSTENSGHTDDLSDTVDYGAICERIEHMIRDEQFLLLERLANRTAEVILEFAGVIGVRLAVRKLRPPVPQQLHSSGVGLVRWASGVPTPDVS